MAVSTLNAIKIVGQKNKDYFNSLTSDDLRQQLRAFTASKNYVFASYVSRLLARKRMG